MNDYGIPADHIFSSRDDTFAKGIMRATNNRGVDVVLNSLAGEVRLIIPKYQKLSVSDMVLSFCDARSTSLRRLDDLLRLVKRMPNSVVESLSNLSFAMSP